MLNFDKYSATGNDFIVIDNREQLVRADDHLLWTGMCARRTGVGADGVLLLQHHSQFDFEMQYINADGLIADLCGNGARAITHFAHHQLALSDTPSYRFQSGKEVYHGNVDGDDVCIRLPKPTLNPADELPELYPCDRQAFLNVGVPHVVYEVTDTDAVDVATHGRRIRQDRHFSDGANVNFVSVIKTGHIRLRTYERGVESETLACGTGAVASALTHANWHGAGSDIIIEANGGRLLVHIDSDSVTLSGGVRHVYRAVYNR